jgi:Protein tyrosine phosphatase-like protein, PTPLA
MATPDEKRSSKSPLAPLAPLFSIFNWVAFVGWLYVLFMMVSSCVKGSSQQAALEPVRFPVIVLEGICAVEVLRIALGDVPGNLLLGTILHTIRFTAILEVLPRAAAICAIQTTPSWPTVTAVLISWSVTEVTRYPMYMFPVSSPARSIRMVMPLVTFPIGCVAEFAGACQVLFMKQEGTTVPVWLKFLLVVMMFVNGVLGPCLAYPALLKKGLPVLGLAKPPVTKATTTRTSKTNEGPKPNIKSC